MHKIMIFSSVDQMMMSESEQESLRLLKEKVMYRRISKSLTAQDNIMVLTAGELDEAFEEYTLVTNKLYTEPLKKIISRKGLGHVQYQ